MNVSLTPRLEEMIKKRVASGLYNSASEVIREALRLLEDEDRMRELRIRVLKEQATVGLDQLDGGQYTEHDADSLGEFFEDVNSSGRTRRTKRKGSDV